MELIPVKIVCQDYLEIMDNVQQTANKINISHKTISALTVIQLVMAVMDLVHTIV